MHAEGGLWSQIRLSVNSLSHLQLGNLPHLVQTSCLKTAQRRIEDDSLSQPESPRLPSGINVQ